MSTLYVYEWLTLPRLPGAAVEVMSDGRLWAWLSCREAFQYYGHNTAAATCALDGVRTVEMQCEGKAVTLYRVQVGLLGYIPPGPQERGESRMRSEGSESAWRRAESI